MSECKHEYILGPRCRSKICKHCNRTRLHIEMDILRTQRDDLLAACEVARDWAGLDGDGIDEPVLTQLKVAIDKAKGESPCEDT